MIKISQCMIVKNEEKNIERALSWGKELFFEQIVVDTGSTDQTVLLAQKMGVTVYFFPWIDDFAAAKNYALEQARGKWIVFLDADEYFKKEDVIKLKNIIEIIDKKVIRVDDKKKKTNALLCALANLNWEGRVFSTGAQLRVFRNDKNIRYIGQIHEQITGLNGTRIVLADATDDLTIFHTGYGLKEKQNIFQKANRNIQLIKKQLEIDPDNPDWNLYMADTLAFNGDIEESIKYTNKALERKKELTIKNGIEYAYSRIMHQLLNEIEEKEENLFNMKRVYREATKINSIYPDYDIFLAFGYLRKANDWHSALYYLEKGLEKLENKENRINGSKGVFYIEEIYYYLVLGYLKEGNKVKCVQNAVIYLKMNRFHEEVLRILLSLLKDDTCNNKEIYQFLTQIYQFENKKDSLFVQKAAFLEGMAELAEILKMEQEHVLS